MEREKAEWEQAAAKGRDAVVDGARSAARVAAVWEVPGQPEL